MGVIAQTDLAQAVVRGPIMKSPPLGAYTLHDGTGMIGWIADNRLGFTGFSSVTEAATAAWVAHMALERRAAKSRGEVPPYIEPGSMQLVRSDGTEWIEMTTTRLARLVRPAPSATERADRLWFGIEIVLPPNASELETGSSAQVVYRALRRSGIRWPIRNVEAPVTDSTDARARVIADDVRVLGRSARVA